MKHTFESIKILPDTHAALRYIAAITGDKQYEVVQRLVREEAARVQRMRELLHATQEPSHD